VELLFRLLALLFAARLAAEVAERLKLPAVLLEISAGALLGPSVLGVVGHDEPLHFLGELGAIFLLLEVGIHMDLADLRRVGRAAMLVAAVGIVAPIAAGFGAMRALGIDGTTAMFLGAGITATSVGITARVFADMRALATTEAQTVLGAAVADDVLGLLILTIVTRLASGGSVTATSVLGVAAVGIGFVAVATAVGTWLAPLLFDRYVGRARTEGTLIGAAIAFTVAFAGLAQAARLAPIVGAFVAGVALGRIKEQEDLRRRLAPVTHLFVPVFFLLIGAEARVGAIGDARAFILIGVLGVVAVLGKVIAGVVADNGDRLLIGIGMIPRGEVGVVFATLGLASGALRAREHAVLLVVVLLTTVIAPPALRRRIEYGRRTALERAAEAEPEDGWLVSTSEVELRAEPPLGLAAKIGLQAALLCAERRPGQKLLEWLSRAQVEPPRWDEELRGLFLTLLRSGNPRSWRFLDVTGLLPALWPEVEAEMRRRKQDPFDLDPAGALRWAEVEAVLELSHRQDDRAFVLWANIDQKAVLVAALARSAFRGDVAAGTGAAERFAQKLGLTERQIDLVRFLVTERGLLPAAASRLSLGNEETVLELAAHAGDRERAAALYFLAAATITDPTHREALDELYGLVIAALAHPELVGSEAADLAEARKREAIKSLPRIPDPIVRRLLDAAPRRYLLVHPPHVIARHVRMLEPPTAKGEVRIHAEPDLEHGEWTVDIVTMDRPGALAAITRAFSTCDVPILEAWISTWTNGVIVDVFRAAAARDVDWDAVRLAAAAALQGVGPNGSQAPIDGRIDLDNAASPWHTIVEIGAHDRTGLLYKVADAFTKAGIQIHHATVQTASDVAVDTFLVTDRDGHKLNAARERDLRLAFAGKLRRRWAPSRLLKRPRGAPGVSPGDKAASKS
jgi:Kef-type K+ transport system membrane component KefB/glycine cleavage system regulatory protein